MNFVHELCKAIDPEAFEDVPPQDRDWEKAERLYLRQQELTSAVCQALGRLGENFKIVEIPIPSYDGDYYEIDGYGDGVGKAGTLYLNERRIGAFMVILMQFGGRIRSMSAFNARYKDCHVSAIIQLHPSRKDEFEKMTGLKLKEPGRLVPA